MRKVKLICLLLSYIFISGCSSNPVNYSDNYLFGQDAQFGFLKYGGFGCVAEAENGYYFMSGPQSWFLYFYDKEKKQAVPLCNKPNCLHTDETDSKRMVECNAYIGSVEFLKYYMGNLYCVMDNSSVEAAFRKDIYTISSDGTARKVFLECREYIQDMQIHRGNIYFSTSDMGFVEEGKNSCFKLFRYDMDKAGAKPEVVFEGSGEDGNIGDIICYGNDIFFEAHYNDDKELISIIYRYDIRTKSLTIALDKGSPYFTIFNGKLVYNRRGTHACDLDGSNLIQINDRKGLICANEKYLFIDNAMYAATQGIERTLSIVDKNWKNGKTISLPGMKLPPLGCSNEYYFIPQIGENNESGQTVLLQCIPVNGSMDDMKLTTFYDYILKASFTH